MSIIKRVIFIFLVLLNLKISAMELPFQAVSTAVGGAPLALPNSFIELPPSKSMDHTVIADHLGTLVSKPEPKDSQPSVLNSSLRQNPLALEFETLIVPDGLQLVDDISFIEAFITGRFTVEKEGGHVYITYSNYKDPSASSFYMLLEQVCPRLRALICLCTKIFFKEFENQDSLKKPIIVKLASAANIQEKRVLLSNLSEQEQLELQYLYLYCFLYNGDLNVLPDTEQVRAIKANRQALKIALKNKDANAVQSALALPFHVKKQKSFQERIQELSQKADKIKDTTTLVELVFDTIVSQPAPAISSKSLLSLRSVRSICFGVFIAGCVITLAHLKKL